MTMLLPSALDAPDPLVELLAQSHRSLLPQLANKSLKAQNAFLQQQAATGTDAHARICNALLYGILSAADTTGGGGASSSSTSSSSSSVGNNNATPPAPPQALFQLLSTSVRDAYAHVVQQLLVIVGRLHHRLTPAAAHQLLWLTRELVTLDVRDMDAVIAALLRQVQGGSHRTAHVTLTAGVLDLLMHKRAWLTSGSDAAAGGTGTGNAHTLLPLVLYHYLRLLHDHHRVSPLAALRERELAFVRDLIHEHTRAFARLGRDGVRLVRHASVATDLESVWKLLWSPWPSSSSSSSLTLLEHMLATPTPDVYVRARMTPDMEAALVFMLTQVPLGQEGRYQQWFDAAFLSSSAAGTVAADVARFVCVAYHPSNQCLRSNVLPRWALLGWLMHVAKKRWGANGGGSSAQSQQYTRETYRAIVFDLCCWSAFAADGGGGGKSRELIMNAEPAMLLMRRSLPKYVSMTSDLLHTLHRETERDYPSPQASDAAGLVARVKLTHARAVDCGFQALVAAGVVDRDGLRMVLKCAQIHQTLIAALTTTLPHTYALLNGSGGSGRGTPTSGSGSGSSSSVTPPPTGDSLSSAKMAPASTSSSPPLLSATPPTGLPSLNLALSPTSSPPLLASSPSSRSASPVPFSLASSSQSSTSPSSSLASRSSSPAPFGGFTSSSGSAEWQTALSEFHRLIASAAATSAPSAPGSASPAASIHSLLARMSRDEAAGGNDNDAVTAGAQQHDEDSAGGVFVDWRSDDPWHRGTAVGNVDEAMSKCIETLVPLCAKAERAHHNRGKANGDDVYSGELRELARTLLLDVDTSGAAPLSESSKSSSSSTHALFVWFAAHHTDQQVLWLLSRLCTLMPLLRARLLHWCAFASQLATLYFPALQLTPLPSSTFSALSSSSSPSAAQRRREQFCDDVDASFACSPERTASLLHKLITDSRNATGATQSSLLPVLTCNARLLRVLVRCYTPAMLSSLSYTTRHQEPADVEFPLLFSATDVEAADAVPAPAVVECVIASRHWSVHAQTMLWALLQSKFSACVRTDDGVVAAITLVRILLSRLVSSSSSFSPTQSTHLWSGLSTVVDDVIFPACVRVAQVVRIAQLVADGQQAKPKPTTKAAKSKAAKSKTIKAKSTVAGPTQQQQGVLDAFSALVHDVVVLPVHPVVLHHTRAWLRSWMGAAVGNRALDQAVVHGLGDDDGDDDGDRDEANDISMTRVWGVIEVTLGDTANILDDACCITTGKSKCKSSKAKAATAKPHADPDDLCRRAVHILNVLQSHMSYPGVVESWTTWVWAEFDFSLKKLVACKLDNARDTPAATLDLFRTVQRVAAAIVALCNDSKSSSAAASSAAGRKRSRVGMSSSAAAQSASTKKRKKSEDDDAAAASDHVHAGWGDL